MTSKNTIEYEPQWPIYFVVITLIIIGIIDTYVKYNNTIHNLLSDLI